MALNVPQYLVDDEIANFFTKTSVSRNLCDAIAIELVGGRVIPVAVQGVCSYTVYAGANLEHVVQFRLKSLELKMAIAELARRIYGRFAPDVSLKRQLGDDSTNNGKEPLLVYVMTRIRGISYLDFKIEHGFPENSPENMMRRRNLIQDVARFFALGWNASQRVDQKFRIHMQETFENELRQLLVALPQKFQSIVQATLASLPQILSLPMVLVHKDLGDCNIIVSEPSCHLVGVVDWAEAEIGPFGTNLHSIQDLMSKLHLKNGWIRYEDYDTLERLFWDTLSDSIGGLDGETVNAVKAARSLGLLRSRGFSSRLANEPEATPIKSDNSGRYNMMILDGLFLDPETRLT